MAIKISGTTVIDDTRNLTSINTAATGNTTITGFINATANISTGSTGSIVVGSTLIANSTGPYGKTEGNLNVNAAARLTTSRNINGVGFNGTGDILVPSSYDSNYRRITNPGGAEYVSTSSSVTGALQITLPVGYTNTMMRMTIRVYNYASNESFDIICGGYNYLPATSSWYNTFAYILGNPNTDRRFTVRFGFTAGGKCCVYIGELASVWSYPQFYVTDVQLGFGGQTANWVSGWATSVQASAFENVTSTITAAQIGYATSTNTTGAVALRDGSGNFSAGTITANLTGTASNATLLNNKSEGNLNVNNATTAYGKTEGNLNVNNATTSTRLTTTDIPGSADLDTYTTAGIYHQGLNAQAASGSNYPIAEAGLLEVYTGGSMVYQRYTHFSTGTIYTRSKYLTTWYAWDLVLDDGNFNSYAPTLTGGGASGTWSINVTGTAYGKTEGNLNVNNAAYLGGTAAASYDKFPSTTKMLFVQTAAPTGWTKETVNYNDYALRVTTGTATPFTTGVAFTTAFALKSVVGTIANTLVTGTTSTNNATGSISSNNATGTVDANTLSGSTANFTLGEAHIPSHNHKTIGNVSGAGGLSVSNTVNRTWDGTTNLDYSLRGSTTAATLGPTDNYGTSGGHSHSIAGLGSHAHSFTPTPHLHIFTPTGHSHTFTADTHGHTFTGTSINLDVNYVDVIICTKN